MRTRRRNVGSGAHRIAIRDDNDLGGLKRSPGDGLYRPFMQGAPRRFGRALAVALLLSVALAPLLARPASAFGERAYDANTVIGGGDPFFLVWSGESVAQSFTASESYVLLNLTLRLRNTAGTGNLVNITIRPDAGGVPSAGYLAWSNVQAPGTVGPVNVSLTPSVDLARGVLWWIVATKGGPQNQAYEWHHSGANTYAGGKAMVNTGTGWVNPATATDMWFVTYGREIDANLSVHLTASTARALPKDTVVFTVYVNNTGTLAAPRAWLNDTLPAGLTYVSDTSSSVPALTGFPNYTFANLPNGAHSFAITAQVNVEVAPGTTLTNVAVLVYTNATGIREPPRSAAVSIVIGLQGKSLYFVPESGATKGLTPVPPSGGVSSQVVYTFNKGGASLDFELTAPLARTFRAQNVTVDLYLDSMSHGVKNILMNFTLYDANGSVLSAVAYDQLQVTTDNVAGFQRFTYPFPALDYNFSAGHAIDLRIRNLASSQDNALVATNATATPSQAEILTPTYVRVDALALRDLRGPATVWSPKDSLVVWANVSDPFGATEIAGATINLTDPSGAPVLASAPMAVLRSGPPGWKLYGATEAPPLANGTYAIEVVAEESNGVLAYAVGSAVVRAPAFTSALVPSQPSALSGDTVALNLWYNNTGTGPAGRTWINISLPSQLVFVTSSAESNRTGPTNWTWANLAVGSHLLIIQVMVRSDIPPAPSLTIASTLSFTDEKGFPWPSVSTSAGIVLQGPILSLSFGPSETRIHSNESFVLSTSLRNTGDPAGTVWLNLTWPSSLAYVSDTSGSLGGTSTPVPGGVDIEIAGMGSGAAGTVNVTVRSGSGLPRGLNLTLAAGLAYTNARGAMMPRLAAAASVLVIAPEIVNASIDLLRSVANPGDLVPGTVRFSNVGDETALSLVVTLALSPGLSFVNASLPATVSGSAVLFALSDVRLGAHAFFLNVTVVPGTADRSVLSLLGSLVYTDSMGNPLAPVLPQAAALTVTAPVFRLSASPADPLVEAGTRVTYRIDPDNLGTGAAKDVWLNVTLPTDLVYSSDSSDGQATVAGTHLSWYWPAFGTGSRAFNLTLAADGDVANGTRDGISLTIRFADANGNLGPPVDAAVSVSVVAPTIQVTLQASVASVPDQTTFYYTLRIRNLGATTAKTVWLLDSVDPDLSIISYTSNVEPTGAPNLNWTYAELQPGEEQAITLFVQLGAGVQVGAQVPNFISAVFTNSQGLVLGAVQSNAVVVTAVAPPSPLPYIAGAVFAAGALLAVVVYRRRSSRIEEVFLINSAGLVIDHLSRALVHDKDADIVGGMLTGVQDFAREAFEFRGDEKLQVMEFGDKHVLLVRGRDVYLAAVISGKNFHGVETKLKRTLAHIESEFGPTLAQFNGRVTEIRGVREDLAQRLLR